MDGILLKWYGPCTTSIGPPGTAAEVHEALALTSAKDDDDETDVQPTHLPFRLPAPSSCLCFTLHGMAHAAVARTSSLQELVEQQLKASVSSLRASLPKPASAGLGHPAQQQLLPSETVEALWELAQRLWNHAVGTSNHATLQRAAQQGGLPALDSGLVEGEGAAVAAAGATPLREGAAGRDVAMQEAGRPIGSAAAAAAGGMAPVEVVVLGAREVATHIAWLRHLASELAAMTPLPSNLQVRHGIAK